MKSTFIQIGVTAARDPETGDFLPAEPIFKEVTPELEKAEADTYNDVGKMFVEKMKHYIEGGGLIEKQGERRRYRDWEGFHAPIGHGRSE